MKQNVGYGHKRLNIKNSIRSCKEMAKYNYNDKYCAKLVDLGNDAYDGFFISILLEELGENFTITEDLLPNIMEKFRITENIAHFNSAFCVFYHYLKKSNLEQNQELNVSTIVNQIFDFPKSYFQFLCISFIIKIKEESAQIVLEKYGGIEEFTQFFISNFLEYGNIRKGVLKILKSFARYNGFCDCCGEILNFLCENVHLYSCQEDTYSVLESIIQNSSEPTALCESITSNENNFSIFSCIPYYPQTIDSAFSLIATLISNISDKLRFYNSFNFMNYLIRAHAERNTALLENVLHLTNLIISEGNDENNFELISYIMKNTSNLSNTKNMYLHADNVPDNIIIFLKNVLKFLSHDKIIEILEIEFIKSLMQQYCFDRDFENEISAGKIVISHYSGDTMYSADNVLSNLDEVMAQQFWNSSFKEVDVT